MRLAIYTTATTGYGRALTAQARKIAAAISLEKRIKQSDILIIPVTDDYPEIEEAVKTYKELLPLAEVAPVVNANFSSGAKNYDRDSQLLISQMRTAATVSAIAWGADRCLSLDGDVLPPHNSIRCMLDMLEFDNGYYGATFCPYPSHGGGAFLGGRGSHTDQIFPDAYEDEKEIPKKLLAEREALNKKLEELSEKKQKPPKKLIDQLNDIRKQIRGLPPKDNVFNLNGKKWKRRGWFDAAYPAIGKGAVVPVDWTGFGCLMMNKEALALCDWTGYEGRGTEDLFINYRRWEPNGIRMCCIPHCPCDHVVRNSDPKKRLGDFVHINTGHVLDGEYIGHLRQWPSEWYAQRPGERARDEEINKKAEKNSNE
jgi:hypothetical protein